MNNEDIEILEEFKKNGYSMLYMKYGDRNTTNLKLERALENLLTRYKELEEENKNMREEYLVNNPGMAKYLKDNYIFKSKVIEKIEELDIQISECEYADDDIEERKQDIEKEKRLLLRDKKTLQDLLGKE